MGISFDIIEDQDAISYYIPIKEFIYRFLENKILLLYAVHSKKNVLKDCFCSNKTNLSNFTDH